jgi:hypothetical protein
MDPDMVANWRAQHRKDAMSSMRLQEDTAILDDLAAAEEDYDEPEQHFNEAGIPIEPFHLRREREEGMSRPLQLADTMLLLVAHSTTEAGQHTCVATRPHPAC